MPIEMAKCLTHFSETESEIEGLDCNRVIWGDGYLMLSRPAGCA
jgi:hypothetical protein